MKKIIVLVGPVAAGKETIGLYLSDRFGIHTYENSQEISDQGVLGNIVVPEEIEKLRQEAEVLVLAVDAQASLRYERHLLDHPHSSPESLQHFVNQELQGNSPPNRERVFDCMQLADHTIENNGSLAELYSKVDEIITQAGLKS